jgi:protein subunit release factor A
MREKLFSVTIKDCEIQTFRSGGKGGQHQNKTESGVRIIHHPSGAIGESREERDQLQNKKKAFRKMGESKKFQTWAKCQALDKIHQGLTIEEKVENAMAPENVKVEVIGKDGNWELELNGS